MGIKMFLLFVVLLVFVALPHSAHCEYPIPKPKEIYRDQILDHFNFEVATTFKQRILYSDDAWINSTALTAPIFFYTGNEGPIDEFYQNSGFVFELAAQFHALVIFAEHRYYGKSMPFGAASQTPENIGFLSVEQVLADYATLIPRLKTEFGGEESVVVTFGGSYGGSLSAYMRMRYPTVVDASLAASAPILLYPSETGSNLFFQQVTKDFADYHKDCPSQVKGAFAELSRLAEHGQFVKIANDLKLCSPVGSVIEVETEVVAWIRNAFTFLAMMDYPYPTNFMGSLPAWPVRAACNYLLEDTGNEKLSKLSRAIGLFYNGTGTLSCFNITDEFFTCADASGCGGNRQDPNALSWDYQACTEIIHDIGTNGETDMFPARPWTIDGLTNYCKLHWGVEPRPAWMPLNTNLKTSSRIIFSNGDLDPWHVGGVLDSLSDDLIAIRIADSAHHLDLRGSDPADPPSVTAARMHETKILSKWIQEAQEERRQGSN